MDEAVRKDVDAHDADVKEFFRKGLEQLRHDYEPKNPAGATSESAHRGVELTYTEKLSDEDAFVLRRMLSTNLPVRKICISEISLSAFRIAFDDFRGCSSLEELQLLVIVCQGEDFSIRFSELFSGLRSLDLRYVLLSRNTLQAICERTRHLENSVFGTPAVATKVLQRSSKRCR